MTEGFARPLERILSGPLERDLSRALQARRSIKHGTRAPAAARPSLRARYVVARAPAVFCQAAARFFFNLRSREEKEEVVCAGDRGRWPSGFSRDRFLRAI